MASLRPTIRWRLLLGLFTLALWTSLLILAHEIRFPFERTTDVVGGIALLVGITALVGMEPGVARLAPVTLVLSFLLIGLVPDRGPARAILVAWSFLPLAMGRPRFGFQRHVLPGIVSATIGLGILSILSHPVLYGRTLRISSLISGGVSSWLGESGELGPDVWLFPLFVLALTHFLFSLLFVRRPLIPFVPVLVALLILPAHFLHRSPAVTISGLAIDLFLWALLFRPSRELRFHPGLLGGVSAAACLLLILPGSVHGRVSTPENARIAFVSSDQYTTSLPPSSWKIESVMPRFGLWVEYLRGIGVTTTIVEGPLTAKKIGNVGTLVLINNCRSFRAAEMDVVDAFLRGGGKLLVLADHTDVQGQRGPTNELLSRYGISLNFDSAVPLDEDWNWTGCLRTLATSAFPAGDEAARFRWRVGCSLALTGEAMPLLVGRHSFSDSGDPENVNGFLGNLRPDPGEAVGGQVLAAAAPAGKGRVIVCGDTSSFQDACLAANLEFIGAFTAYLIGDDSWIFGRDLSTSLLLAAGSLVVIGFVLRPILASIGVGLILGACIPSLFGPGGEPAPLPDGPIAWLDRPRGFAAHTQVGENATFGLETGLVRFGFFPLHVPGSLSAALERGGSLLVILGPRARYRASDLEALDRFLERGGMVWIFGGHDEYLASPELFEHLEISLPFLPLGSNATTVLEATGEPVLLREAWPIVAEGWSTVLAVEGHPVVVTRSLRGGTVRVCGDPYLFLGSGLQEKTTVHRGNAGLFEVLLGEAACTSE